jgi:hypothetical protein
MNTDTTRMNFGEAVRAIFGKRLPRPPIRPPAGRVGPAKRSPTGIAKTALAFKS